MRPGQARHTLGTTQATAPDNTHVAREDTHPPLSVQPYSPRSLAAAFSASRCSGAAIEISAAARSRRLLPNRSAMPCSVTTKCTCNRGGGVGGWVGAQRSMREGTLRLRGACRAPPSQRDGGGQLYRGHAALPACLPAGRRRLTCARVVTTPAPGLMVGTMRLSPRLVVLGRAMMGRPSGHSPAPARPPGYNDAHSGSQQLRPRHDTTMSHRPAHLG